MLNRLVIAEKPSVAQSIAAVIGAKQRHDGYLSGSGYIVSWCFGHLAELSDASAYNADYANGRPCEQTVITNAFNRLKRDAGLPNVVFHSLRHSSTTYKLKLNHGDLKATQGDTGHAQVDMITKIYAHILDEDRKVNAQRFEAAFYSNPDLRSVHAPEEPQASPIDVQSLIEQIQQSPELLAAISSLLVPKTS